MFTLKGDTCCLVASAHKCARSSSEPLLREALLSVALLGALNHLRAQSCHPTASAQGLEQHQAKVLVCSDITNDQLGISGETGTVAQISVFIE